MKAPLYVIAPIFNPRRFASRYRLYHAFERYMAASGATLLTVELAFGARPFEVTSDGDPWNLQLRTNAELWHKERLINLGIQRLLQIAPGAEYIAWIDADVTFSRPDWASETVHLLQHFDVVQPFGEAINLNPQGERMWSCPSLLRHFHGRGYHQEPPLPSAYCVKGHPGLAWAARRDTLDALGGLIDFCVVGSGDSYMGMGLCGGAEEFLPCNPDNVSPGFARAVRRWWERAASQVRENVGYVPGACMHHWHGKSVQRGYDKRSQIVQFHGFDPTEDLRIESNGLYNWSGKKPRLEHDLRRSMSDRNEDSIDE